MQCEQRCGYLNGANQRRENVTFGTPACAYQVMRVWLAGMLTLIENASASLKGGRSCDDKSSGRGGAATCGSGHNLSTLSGLELALDFVQAVLLRGPRISLPVAHLKVRLNAAALAPKV